MTAPIVSVLDDGQVVLTLDTDKVPQLARLLAAAGGVAGYEDWKRVARDLRLAKAQIADQVNVTLVRVPDAAGAMQPCPAPTTGPKPRSPSTRRPATAPWTPPSESSSRPSRRRRVEP